MKVPATFEFEKSLWKQDKNLIVGIDEVGRGAWAGPLVSAAVIFPKDFKTKVKLYDSKLLTPLEREKLTRYIQENSVGFGVGSVEVLEIAELGLTAATQLSYLRALENLSHIPDHYLIDAFYIKSLPKHKQTPIIHGDYFCSSIAAASIVAKAYRDQVMRNLSAQYTGFDLENNKGYGTKKHQEAIQRFGLTDLHRQNYHLKFLDG